MAKPGDHEVRTSKGETRENVNAKKPPFSAIASLKFFKEGQLTGSGTGFLVKDGDSMFIATAAHCFTSESESCVTVDRVQYTFGLNQDYQPFGSFHKGYNDMIISSGYSHYNPHDYGVIRLDQDDNQFLPKDSWFILCDDNGDLTSRELFMSGYPQLYYEKNAKKRYEENDVSGIQLKTNVVLEKDVKDNEFLCYRDTTCEGNSGSPIYYKEGDNYIAVGIHCTGNKDMNRGVRIGKVEKRDLLQMATGTKPNGPSLISRSRKRSSTVTEESSHPESINDNLGKKKKSTNDEDSD